MFREGRVLHTLLGWSSDEEAAPVDAAPVDAAPSLEAAARLPLEAAASLEAAPVAAAPSLEAAAPVGAAPVGAAPVAAAPVAAAPGAARLPLEAAASLAQYIADDPLLRWSPPPTSNVATPLKMGFRDLIAPVRTHWHPFAPIGTHSPAHTHWHPFTPIGPPLLKGQPFAPIWHPWAPCFSMFSFSDYFVFELSRPVFLSFILSFMPFFPTLGVGVLDLG